MKVSVIIPTYNGAKKLPAIVSALREQTFKEFNTIVMIDGSTDNTIDIIKKLTLNFPLTIIRQENLGRAKVRNAGAYAANADLLIFFDDDMRPEPLCIENHIKHHQKYPNSLMSGAQIDDYEKADTDFLKYKCRISRQWSGALIPFKDQPLPLSNLYLTAANFSVSKELFLELGGFDERLRDAEDFDLAIRAFQSNIPVYYNHDAFAWHDDIVSFPRYIKRLREYQYAHIKLRQLKPAQYKDVELRKPQMPSGLKKLIFSLFANPLWIQLFNRKNTYLPTRVKHKLYDLVTTAYGTFFTDRPL